MKCEGHQNIFNAKSRDKSSSKEDIEVSLVQGQKIRKYITTWAKKLNIVFMKDMNNFIFSPTLYVEFSTSHVSIFVI